MTSKEGYLKEVLNQVPRLLGLLNRNPLSKTYGCFDRQFWQYNALNTPSARSQETVLTLALLYNIKSTPYYKNKLLLKWINAALNFWVKIQEKNGSFNEWYPYENSFVATAFSSYAISETLLLLKDNIKNKDLIIKSLKKAGNWLLMKKEKRVQNQEAGAVIAFYNLFLLTNESIYKRYAEKKSKSMAKHQTKEGWFYEYGGADIGYLSLLVDYMAKYYQKSRDKKILRMLNKSIDFLSYFVHPNLTFGGEYGSRNTEYLIPSGFEILAKENEKAAIIAKNIREAIKNKATISPSSLDDRYLTYITYNWLQAYLNASLLKPKRTKFNENFSKNFELAQIYILSNQKIYLIISYGKGGSFKLFFKGKKKVVYDSGILVKTNKKLMSGYLTNENKVEISDDMIKVSGLMSEVKNKSLSPLDSIMLNVFQLTIGKNQKIGFWVKEKLRDKLVTSQKKGNIKFTREVLFNNLEIMDKVEGKNIKEVIIGSKHSYAYTPSSRYFQKSELNNKPFTIKNLKKANLVIVRRSYKDDKLLKIITCTKRVKYGNQNT